MSSVLNITNGDCAVAVMEEAGITGRFLPWRDVLHDGPVPQGLSLEELSEVRAKFISDCGWGEYAEVLQSFIERDNVLKSFQDYDKVILWFEHDLYDQLQLLQILDWFHGRDLGSTRLSIVCTDRYLGPLTPDEMSSLLQYEVPVIHSQIELAKRSWEAFKDATPEKWYALLKQNTGELPFLEAAIVRMLEEFPGRKNGLSRTEQQALEIIAAGEKQPGKIFGRNQNLEERMFLGDSSFWNLLHGFLESSPPLIALEKDNELTLPENPDQELAITSAGEEVLSGKRNWLDIRAIDRWIGGIHLTPDNAWCWDSVGGINWHNLGEFEL
ncbi:MAG: hypothetical protein PVG66_01130 [Chromatiales bacterium]|jgi:hypothetical protein